MTSIAMAVGVVRLGRHHCLVQDLPAIEQLARGDTVCTDKTGTLTEDGMRVSRIEAVDGAELSEAHAAEIAEVLATIGRVEGKPNSSMRAILEHVADALSETGLRVLAVASTDAPLSGASLPESLVPEAIVVLDQRLRSEAPGTLEYFAQQQVSVKVISGDNAAAVGAIAEQAGVPEGRTAVDARTLQEDTPEFAAAVTDHTAFGRVSPTQKRAMVHALQGNGRVVAMTGDGVNDVLALKDADVGVAMGSGSPAARAVSRIVLLSNSFATLLHIVAEGRRVIGNIERVATLFLTKTLYSALLALFAVIVAVPYPFLPRHVKLIAWFTIGIPAFFLALAPNTARAQDGFVRRVLSEAIPGGIGAAFASFGAYLTARAVFGVEEATRVMNSSTAFLALITVAFFVLVMVARPFRWWKSLLVACMIGGMLVVILTPLGSSLFDIDLRDWRAVTIALGFGLGGIGVRVIARRITRRYMLKRG